MSKENQANYNVLMIPNFQEPLEYIVQDYAAMALTCKDVEEFENLLYMYHDEISTYIKQAQLIDDIDKRVQKLKEINDRLEGYRE
jgi:hypothetical protein